MDFRCPDLTACHVARIAHAHRLTSAVPTLCRAHLSILAAVGTAWGVVTMIGARRWSLCLCALTAAASVASCATSNNAGSTRGVLRGTLHQTGGPKVVNVPQTPRPLGHEAINITRGGKMIDSAETGADGSFSINLSPGTYRVRAHVCGFYVSVVITPHRTTSVALVCPVP